MKSKTLSCNLYQLGALMSLLIVSHRLSFAETTAPTFSGYVDTNYVYNFNKPLSGTNALRSFDAKDNNIFSTAQLGVSGQLNDQTGYLVKFLAGSDAAAITSGGAGGADDFDIQEAFLTYACPTTKINLKAGKFVTLQGIELIESKDNPTISRGYLFGLAEPFTHAGALATRSFGKLELGAGVVNGWDIVSDNNKSKTLVGKAGLNFGDPLTFNISGYHGSEQARDVSISTAPSVEGNNRSSVDLTGVTKIIPKVALWFQANWGQEERIVDLNGDGLFELATWGGAGIQPVVSITDKFSVGARWEYFDDDEGARTGTAGLAATNYTITPAYKCTDNMTVRAEYRYDRANKKVWQDDEGVAKDKSSTVGLQFLLVF